MSRPLQIGITGGIGSGKTLVCKIFHSLGIPIYDADSRAKILMTTDGILVEQIKKEFGMLSYNEDGSLNRKYLGQIAFDQKQKLETLNHLVHPRVAKDYEGWVSTHQHFPYVMKEAALLFESGSYKGLDKIVVVSAPEKIRMKRVLQRDTHRTEKDVENIFGNQLSEDKKLQRADFVIINDETRLVIPQVLELHERFSSLN
jgi:dephospho-CoA kinase